MFVINEREQIKKEYRKKLEDEYIVKKTAELKSEVAKQPEPLPEITFEMLKAKYHALRKGLDNVDYLEKMCMFLDIQGRRKKKCKEESKEQMNVWLSSTLKGNSLLFGSMKPLSERGLLRRKY
jgi:hypothetical protein